MGINTRVKLYINQFLKVVNLRLETLTADRMEQRRLRALAQSGYFERPIFPLPPKFERIDYDHILIELQGHRRCIDDLEDPLRNDVGYTFNNEWFSSPDAEILYTLVRGLRPRTICEVGCGYSTKIMRQAINDGQLGTQLISIDPHPRIEIRELVDKFHPQPVETLPMELLEQLGDGDILFIDSSHEIKTGNDVVFLYLHVIPKLRPGVIIHIHDIFLPFEYPREWIMEEGWRWNEQYLVQALLMFSDVYEVLWAGYYLQRTLKEFASNFPHLNGRTAKSLWLRKTA